MRRYKKLILPLLLLGLAPLTASAAVPELTPLNYDTRYNVTIGGLGIGRIRITSIEDMFTYQMIVDTKTQGLVDFFAPLVSVAKVTGNVTPEGGYTPRIYSSVADKDGDDKDRRVNVTYDETGAVLTRKRVPDQTGWRPVVPLEQVKGVPDPMSGFLLLRHQLRDAMANNQREVSITTYDGGRLARMKVKVVSRARIEIDGEHVDAINTVVTRTPIDGYTPKELKKYKEGDPVVHVYFSADERFMPLQATVSLFYGDVRATLVESRAAK